MSPAGTTTTRRMGAVSLVVVVIVGAFFVRLVDIQVVRAAELSSESTQFRTQSATLWAERGQIVDRAGQPLAHNADRYDVTVSPMHVADFRRDGQAVSVMSALAEIESITGTPVAQMWASVSADPEANFGYLTKEVTTAQYRALVDLDIPWMYFERNPERFYPFGSVAGNLTGMMGTDGPLEGVELKWDQCLRAEHGSLVYQRGADSVKLPGTMEVTQEAFDGGNAVLTIDSDLQWFVLQQLARYGQNLGAQSGSAMVVEVDSGDVVAAADWPTYDPNNFADAPQSHLRAATFSSTFEPGSTFKTMTIAALLDQGLTFSEEAHNVPATWELPGGRSIRNASGSAAGNLTTAGILSHSSNTGVVGLAQRIDLTTLHRYYQRFGFGKMTSVEFLGEQSGYLPEPGTADSITRLTQTFGQGLSTTTAQMAGAYQAIANGGERIPLRLVSGCEQADGEFVPAPLHESIRVVSESTAQQTLRILETVPESGTLQTRVDVPGYRIAAKTGTAEIAENGEYGDERMISIAGMVPADDPQYVVVVAFVKPQTNRYSYAAAPAFDAIVTQVVKHFRVPPSGSGGGLPPLTW